MSEWELYCESEQALEDFWQDAEKGFPMNDDMKQMFQKWLDTTASKVTFGLWKNMMQDEYYERNFGDE